MKDKLEILAEILGALWVPLLIAAVFLGREIIGVEDTERIVEKIPFTSTVKYTDQIPSGITCYLPEGNEGTVVREYKIKTHFGKEESRELIKEQVTREKHDGVKVVGTAHRYDGYCSIEGTYRRRYVVCEGDYSPQARQKAEEQAQLCNLSPYNESGCYSTFYSTIYDGTKTCPELNVDEL